MGDQQRPSLPYEFFAPVAELTVASTDISHGAKLSNDQLMNGMGLSGSDVSPHLTWSDAPAETRAFAVTCFDPDAPTGSGFWHWMLFNIPSDVTELSRDIGRGEPFLLPPGAIHARNDLGQNRYVGAAPPEGHGMHRYVFTVHAADSGLELDENSPPALVGFICGLTRSPAAASSRSLVGSYAGPSRSQ